MTRRSTSTRWAVVAAVLLLLTATAGLASAEEERGPRTWWDDFGDPFVFTDPLPFADLGFSTAFATAQAGEPSPTCSPPVTHTVWYRYNATVNSQVTVSTAGSSYDTVLDVFQGWNWNNPIACNDDFGAFNTSQVTFNATAGTTYHIRVSDYFNTGGNLDFNVTNVINTTWWDDFADPFVVNSLPFNDAAGTAMMTMEPGEPTTSCAGDVTHSVWYRYTSPANQSITVSAEQSNYDTVVDVFQGWNWNNSIACADDARAATVTFNATAGTTYHIRVSDWFIPGTGGWLQFSMTGGGGGYSCAGRTATIVGTPGADTLFGTAGQDVIVGLGGLDWIYGYQGNDIICGGGGNDRIFGGLGIDELYGQAGSDRLFGEGGNDQLYGGAGNDQLKGKKGRDYLVGGAGDDVIRGQHEADTLLGLTGNDRLYGGAGNDNINGGAGFDFVSGGAGGDVCTNWEAGTC